MANVAGDQEEEMEGVAVVVDDWFNQETDEALAKLCNLWRRHGEERRIIWDEVFEHFAAKGGFAMVEFLVFLCLYYSCKSLSIH